MLKPIREDSKGEGLGVSDRFVARRAIYQDALQVRDLSDPPAIFFAIYFDGEMHQGWGDRLVVGWTHLRCRNLAKSLAVGRTPHFTCERSAPKGQGAHPAQRAGRGSTVMASLNIALGILHHFCRE
jgi:hypothetical protein